MTTRIRILAAAAVVAPFAACIPSIPGTNTSICIICTESSSTGHGGSGAAAGESPGMPALPVRLPGVPAPAGGAPTTDPAPSAEAEATESSSTGHGGSGAAAGESPGMPALPVRLPGVPAPAGGAPTTDPAPSAEAEAEVNDPAPEAKAPDLMLRFRDFAPDASPAEAGDPEVAETLRDAEGWCAIPCVGPNGHLHIGYGHLLTRAEGDRLLATDIAVAAETAERVVGSAWAALSQRRRHVLIEMAYMLGDQGLRDFRRMLHALRAGDYARAADEIADSNLIPPRRVARLAAAMREG